MSEIGDLLPDVIVEMTDDLYRAFKIAGCKPSCHCCGTPIPTGMEFRLAVVETVASFGGGSPTFNDEMLCNNCTLKIPIDANNDISLALNSSHCPRKPGIKTIEFFLIFEMPLWSF